MARSFSQLLLLLAGSTSLLAGCVDPYSSDVPAAAQNYLVVDGFINSQGSTVIKLSRTLGLASASAVSAETKATVYVLDNAGTRYNLTESPVGTYSLPTQTLAPNRQYQLRITTAKGRNYASDMVAVKTTPPIDKLSWHPTDAGVEVDVDTHDPASASKYYRWDYLETWQFNSAFRSDYEYVASSKSVQPRTNNIFTCWRTEASPFIKQTSTAQLSQDVVSKFPLITLPYTEKLRIKYSVLVLQYAQTPEEYAYWEILSKNTQNLGTLNDPLPTQLTGNVHCLTDASEPVLGYVGAHSVTQARLFIDYNDLPKPLPQIANNPYETCVVDTVALRNGLELFRLNLEVPFDIYLSPPPNSKVIGYFASTTECVDCRVRGTNVKPSFWP
jgi:hypothetical protein